MEPQPSPPKENADAPATFRKPANDAANRSYRRRSPQGGSSSSGGSPIGERSSSPVRHRKDSEKVTDERRKRDDGIDFDRELGRSHYGQSSVSHRSSDHRGSRSYSRNDDYHRRDKYAGDDDRDYYRSRSGREPRSNTYSDHYRRDNEYRSRDHLRPDEKHSWDKSDVLGDKNRDKAREKDSDYQKHAEKRSLSDRPGSGRKHNEDSRHRERNSHNDDKVGLDEKRDHRRSSGDYEGSRSHRNDSTSRKASRNETKQFDTENYKREEKNSEDLDRYNDKHQRETGNSEIENGHSKKDEESAAKKPKLSGFDVDDKQSLGSKQVEEFVSQGSGEQVSLTDSDIDAAKIAAMKAAELVNRNLIGTGIMSADQKKKLLWGNKKTTAKEESGNHWDTTIFGDRERQEKFQKLMGVKGELKAETKPDTEDVEKKREQLQMDLERQYTAGLRRRDGRTVGLGL
ncbi:OLC1v1036435C6 [Oldenlandia corymbosa var. corymbosa]|uniref:OLC1v1036435C6 n=1 Tax=Oldenlandia corymbosa var. corymbosa TaxID=529605 RepID=A0AAV1CX97_OLDCO|nr:OLC1v1036435C6 [Oldenlandia corymbosa var. corymbosa]